MQIKIEVQRRITLDTETTITVEVPQSVLDADDPEELFAWVELNVSEKVLQKNENTVERVVEVTGVDNISS